MEVSSNPRGYRKKILVPNPAGNEQSIFDDALEQDRSLSCPRWDLEATRYSGVATRRVQIWVYILSSLLCWLAAIIMMARFNSAGANIAQSYLLITILAAILTGIDPYGGFGRIDGSDSVTGHPPDDLERF
jgi:hypothetical protein